MNTILHPLQIHMHKVDGSSETFVQNEEGLIKLILREFQPDCIFNRDRIVIADRHSLTSFPVSQLSRFASGTPRGLARRKVTSFPT